MSPARASAARLVLLLITLLTLGVATLSAAGTATAAAVPAGIPAAPDLFGCTSAPTPEVPGRGVVGFFDTAPRTLPVEADPFAADSPTSIYEQYGYAGLRFNTYDLGCGPDIARAPDATVGTAVANWIITLPKAAVAATGAVVSAAFAPDFLGVFDPLISTVVDSLQHTLFEQWFPLVLGAAGLLLIWRARKAALASTAAAIGWALLVMVAATMVFRWPLVAGHAADAAVTSTLGAVSGGLYTTGRAAETDADAGARATAGMHESLLYQAWLGGTFGDANSEVANRYGPVVFKASALTWREARILQTDPAQGQRLIEAKQRSFEQAAQQIKSQDPDAYEYLTGRRSDSRVGYALLAGVAALCAIPFLLVAGLLVIGALIIVRFGVMLFPAFATLGLFPTMRSLVIGIASTVTAALVNAMVFGVGAAVTVLGMGVLLAPGSGIPPWLDVVLMLLLSIVMWVALRPFRRLTQMVSSRTNHFAAAAGGLGSSTRDAARAGGRIMGTALGTFLGSRAAQEHPPTAPAFAGDAPQVAHRAEALTSYAPVVTAAAATGDGAQRPAALVTAAPAAPTSLPAAPVVGQPSTAAGSAAARLQSDLMDDEVYRPQPAQAPPGNARAEIVAPPSRVEYAAPSRASAGTAAARTAERSADGWPVERGSSVAEPMSYSESTLDDADLTDAVFRPEPSGRR